ncbi:MAG: metal ABC transporter permease [Spirochaetaceae bacterium]|jgi:zinc transport system permease protein|nr:metal ABC transporter permease [Spirochaetaceae bacterium]
MAVFSLIETLSEMFSYTFLIRAALVGALVSLCASLLGVGLVLKRYSMIGDGLSHVGFGALALASALNLAPLAVSIPVVVAAAFLLLRISERSPIKGDAAIALISTASLALGVIVISLTTGMNTDVCNYLFGSILAMSKADVRLSVILSAAVLGLFILCYHKIFAVTFDEQFARATGTKTGVFNMALALLTAVTIVLGMRMMGALLISALIIFPALTSMRLCKQFKTVTISAALVSAASFFTGLVLSYLYAIPTGASVVLVNCIAFCLFSLIAAVKPIFKEFSMKHSALTGLILTASLFFFAGCGRGQGKIPAETAETAETNRTGAPAITLAGYAGLNSPVPPPQTKPAPDTRSKAGAGFVEAAEAVKAVKIVEIKEKLFIAQINDIYENPEDYLGKTLKLEGLFKYSAPMAGGEPYYFVMRYGPGCCGNDGTIALEVMWEHGEGAYLPEDAWVEAIGVLKRYEEDGYPYICVSLSSLKALAVRGREFVTQ